MANLRDLKKDIDYLFFEFISDCFMFTSLHTGNKRAEVENLIEEAVEMRNEFFDRVNNPAGKDNPKLIKEYYGDLRRDLFEKVDGYFEKLSTISKEK
ncbi:MAG: hypothetical protein MUP53_06765 [Bacteroidales bacterium]|nr:hypothetical protein [Bacteroidales bacterium]